MRLRIEYRYDPESLNWSFVVPSLGIVGGADTRGQATVRAVEAIEFMLEGDGNAQPPDDGDVEYVEVTIEAG